MISSKKGFISSIVVDTYAYVAFILILILFFALFHLSKVQVQTNLVVSADAANVNANDVLLLYLNSPVTLSLPGQRRSTTLKMPELISLALYSSNKELKNLLDDKTKEFLKSINSRYGSNYAITIFIQDSGSSSLKDPWLGDPLLPGIDYQEAVVPLYEANSVAVIVIYEDNGVMNFPGNIAP